MLSHKKEKYIEDKLLRSSVKELNNLISSNDKFEASNIDQSSFQLSNNMSKNEKEAILTKVGLYLMKNNNSPPKDPKVVNDRTLMDCNNSTDSNINAPDIDSKIKSKSTSNDTGNKTPKKTMTQAEREATLVKISYYLMSGKTLNSSSTFLNFQ